MTLNSSLPGCGRPIGSDEVVLSAEVVVEELLVEVDVLVEVDEVVSEVELELVLVEVVGGARTASMQNLQTKGLLAQHLASFHLSSGLSTL